jgi:hypothetical protein
MPVRTRAQFTRKVATAAMSHSFRLSTLIALALIACGLSGCGTINANLAAGISDTLPSWAGGLPPDVPPRPGTAKYEEFMRERERKRLEPAQPKDQTGNAASSSIEPIH